MGRAYISLNQAMSSVLAIAQREGYVRYSQIGKTGISNGTAARALNELLQTKQLVRHEQGVYRVNGESRPLPPMAKLTWPPWRKRTMRAAAETVEHDGRQVGNEPLHAQRSVFDEHVERQFRRRPMGVRHEATEWSESNVIVPDAIPPRTMEERIIGALQIYAPQSLNLPELARAMYGVSRMDAALPALEATVVALVEELRVDIDTDGAMCLPPTQESRRG
jgi:hypothetical protein